jgi:hypothetical protein
MLPAHVAVATLATEQSGIAFRQETRPKLNATVPHNACGTIYVLYARPASYMTKFGNEFTLSAPSGSVRL